MTIDQVRAYLDTDMELSPGEWVKGYDEHGNKIVELQPDKEFHDIRS